MTRGRIRRTIAALAIAGLTAGAVVALGGSSAPGASSIGYTTILEGGNECRLATVDLATGVVTGLPGGGTSDSCVDDLAVAPDGTVYGITDVEDDGLSANLVTFNPVTGAVTNVQPFSGSFTESFTAHGGLAFDRAGVLYASFTTDEAGCSDLQQTAISCLYRVDPATAAATLVGNAGIDKNGVRMFFLAISCADSMLTGERFTDLDSNDATTDTPTSDTPPAEGASTSPEPAPQSVGDAFADDEVDAQFVDLDLASVNPATGAVTTGPQFAAGTDVLGFDFANPDGPLYALAIEPTGLPGVFTVDPATAALTLVATLSETELENLAIPGGCPVVIQPRFTG
jgi:hypothetical protein